jgi:hypothetical protein
MPSLVGDANDKRTNLRTGPMELRLPPFRLDDASIDDIVQFLARSAVDADRTAYIDETLDIPIVFMDHEDRPWPR